MTGIDWNAVGRLLVLGIGVVLWAYVAFRRTPDLDDVEKAWVYRLSFLMLMLWGWCYVWFDWLNVFPP